MATMIGLFSSIGDHIPIFREDKLVEANPEGIVNRLHYRGTCMFLLVACLMVTCTEWVSGTGSVIECMHGEGLPDAVVRMYCYVQVRYLLYSKPDCNSKPSVMNQFNILYLGHIQCACALG